MVTARWPSGVATAAPTIAFDDVDVIRKGRSVLRVPSLRLRPGVTALVGSNGSGKTTLLHTIAGLLRPAAGQVTVLDADPVDARGRVAYVLQATAVSAQLLVTVEEVVALARAARRGPARRLRPSDRQIVR
ncbi:MAG: ATP-binding cassette domain-containing protein, partial [Ilumatobacteraceae bacterium]